MFAILFLVQLALFASNQPIQNSFTQKPHIPSGYPIKLLSPPPSSQPKKPDDHDLHIQTLTQQNDQLKNLIRNSEKRVEELEQENSALKQELEKLKIQLTPSPRLIEKTPPSRKEKDDWVELGKEESPTFGPFQSASQ